MAKSILLDTSTVNFMDLLGNGRLYRVPPYQRDYSWEEEQWEDLWNDLIDMHGEHANRHYMGALVVEATNDREFLIIDGQQRLATLSIISLAVLKRLQKLVESGIEPAPNTERMAELRKRFIGEKDPASLIESSKLSLNQNDDGFYQDYLVQLRSPFSPRSLCRSNLLLWQCFNYYCRRIEERDGLAESGEALALLLSETVARQLLFILIRVDDELNAYTVFETLNARGLELSATDLLKNYLFSRVKSEGDLRALQRRWQSLVNTVRHERFPEFLRYHLLCEQPKIRTQRLFKIVRDRVASSENVFDLIEALEGRAQLFTALGDPNHEFWIERQECKESIRQLKLFRVRQMTPLFFAAWEKLSAESFARVLKLVSVIVFRHTVVADRNTNELEPMSHHAAKAILSGKDRSPADVFRSLESIYVRDEEFVQAFSDLALSSRGPSKKLMKYILCRLESDLTGRRCDYETDPATIEHILPENPGKEWEQMIEQQHWDRYVYRLGNVTLLESGANRDVANSSYETKRRRYNDSVYELTRQIPNAAPEEWTVSHIEARQRGLAQRAAHLWRSDFS